MSAPLLLDHRAVISVSGADAETFLQGLVTVSTIDVAENETRYGALLTPQGKVIADMLLTRTADGFLLDCDASVSPSLLKRLRLFKLRAAVAIEERSDLGVIAFDGSPDPRAAGAPHRRIAPRAAALTGDPATYHTERIANGIPEQGIDFGAEDVFPADINMDLLGGIDFRKGCFVGQEVVSRMKRRGITRRRTLKAIVRVGTPAPSPILAAGFEIGTLTSISGVTALARVRTDRVAEANAKGEPITVADKPILLDQPKWLAQELAAMAEAKEAKA
ncbi:MAG: folate-binding protein [Hyphomonadaceae bacterium]|nr:folate-binding protein [Hyphomonadaceae bacterium]